MKLKLNFEYLVIRGIYKHILILKYIYKVLISINLHTYALLLKLRNFKKYAHVPYGLLHLYAENTRGDSFYKNHSA